MSFLCGSSSYGEEKPKKMNKNNNAPIEKKIVMVGDGSCGKTSCLNVFTKGFFPEVYAPTIFENYVHDIFVDGKHITLSLWDTAGQEEFDRLRSLSYNDTHVIMLCFSVDSRDSLENIETKWKDEIDDFCKGVKLVLVALKCDLRNDMEQPRLVTPATIRRQESQQDSVNLNKKTSMITYDEGLAVAKRIGAVRYLECSAKYNKGVNEGFTEVTRVALETHLPNETVSPAKQSKSVSTDNETSSKSCTIM
ncbi:ras-domain-containing protein [Hanseniaspora valbyensis NRRL Y-1626]|uniref:GTP-binding protein RHO3 n=1 Tax=Hanseniaspora valbyensis NRRL Y-1626 TaxID=766949 RepID=A0A1B7TE58_9ASCO|nr:ras-domain-containing protein [Hanseniaspora valbyensis NRRL Y-1626]